VTSAQCKAKAMRSGGGDTENATSDNAKKVRNRSDVSTCT